jgi:hypothetical protein
MNKKVFKEMYEQMKPDEKSIVTLRNKITDMPKKQTFSPKLSIATFLLLAILSTFILQQKMVKGNPSKVGFTEGALQNSLLYQLPDEMGKFVCKVDEMFADYYYIKSENPAVLLLDGNMYYEYDRFLSCFGNNNESVWSLSEYVGKTRLIGASEVPKENFDSTISGFLFTFHYHKKSPLIIMLTPSSEVIIFICEQ